MEEKKKKLQEILDSSKSLFLNWNSLEEKEILLGRIRTYLNSLEKEDPFFYAKGLLPKISDSMTLSQFKIFLVPFERELSRLSRRGGFFVSHLDSHSQKRLFSGSLYFVLDNIRSAYNVGSLLRLAECIGVKEVFLTGYTPKEDHEKVKKTSMGAESFLKIRHFERTLEAVAFLQAKNIVVACLETEKSAVDLYDFSCDSKEVALVVGNERHGLSFDVLEASDVLIKIPVWGVKNSLNVSSALSIASYEIKRKISS